MVTTNELDLGMFWTPQGHAADSAHALRNLELLEAIQTGRRLIQIINHETDWTVFKDTALARAWHGHDKILTEWLTVYESVYQERQGVRLPAARLPWGNEADICLSHRCVLNSHAPDAYPLNETEEGLYEEVHWPRKEELIPFPEPLPALRKEADVPEDITIGLDLI